MSREMGAFSKRYHKAVVEAFGGDVEKAKSKIASSWIKDWQEELGETLEDPEEFRSRFQDYLDNELCFADVSDVTLGEDSLEINVENCALCPGNDLLRKQGGEALCPLVPTGLFAISRVHDRKASLDGVEKPGQVGYCKIKYKVEDK
jgi:hypothetical protein